MEKLIKKLLGRLNIAFVLAFTILVSVGFSSINYVLAQDHIATQEASSAKAQSISIVAKTATTTVSTITFPQGAPNSTVSDPYNNIDGSEDPQVLDVSASEPVARLENNSAGSLNITLEITSWTNSIAASQDYELVETGTTTINSVDSVLSSDGLANTASTGETIETSSYKDLYLELTLSGVADKTGTSTLTVLGETP